MIAALLVRGPNWDDTQESARAVVELDPLVRSAAFAYRLYEWRGETLRR